MTDVSKDIPQILSEAQSRWMLPKEIYQILANYKKFYLAPEPPKRPQSGSLFLYDREILKCFKKDGHNWRKKKDGKTTKEAHEKLKVDNIGELHCCYAYGEENENFQRRTYWLLEEGWLSIVLVHYLEIKLSFDAKIIVSDCIEQEIGFPYEGICPEDEEEGNDREELIDCDDEEEGRERKETGARSNMSKMWLHFAKVKVDGVVVKGTCNYCNLDIRYNGTSPMRKHLNTCKSYHHSHRTSDDTKQNILQKNQGNSVGTSKFDPELLRSAFSKMIIEDELPFAFGEKKGFREFMAIACPRFTLPSRKTCARDIVKSFFEQKAKLKLFFQEQCQRVCLTTDCWTSQQQDSYMTVTAHFIDNDWCLHKKILSFFKVKSKRGDDIGKHLQKVLLDWGLDKLMTVTVDNGSSNDSGVSYLRKLNSFQISIAGGKYLHLRCAAHIVNLIVQDGLKEVDTSIKRVRAAVRYVKNATSRLVRFEECAALEKVDSKAFLNLDVCTRWDSTYDMLAAACTYEKVFTRYADEDPYFNFELISVPDEHDWNNARKTAEFLGHFADVIRRVSSSLRVTSHTLFHEIGEANILVRNWMNSGDSVQAAMGKRMKYIYDKYWGQWHENLELDNEKGKENINLLIFIAVVLDPRYKLSKYMEVAIEEMYGVSAGQKVWDALHKCLHGLFEEYRAIYSSPSDVTLQLNDSLQSEQGEGHTRMMKSVVAKRMRLNNGSSSCMRGCRTELEKYLVEECEDDARRFDVLVWWKGQSYRFPILSRLARDVFAIPISAVTSESAFSPSRRILDDFRTSLTPFMLEAFVCTQDWLRRTTPINIAEDTEDLTKLEEELIKEFC